MSTPVTFSLLSNLINITVSLPYHYFFHYLFTPCDSFISKFGINVSCIVYVFQHVTHMIPVIRIAIAHGLLHLNATKGLIQINKVCIRFYTSSLILPISWYTVKIFSMQLIPGVKSQIRVIWLVDFQVPICYNTYHICFSFQYSFLTLKHLVAVDISLN